MKTITETKQEEIKKVIKTIMVVNFFDSFTWKFAPLKNGIAIAGYLKGEPEAMFYVDRKNNLKAGNGNARSWCGMKIDFERSKAINYHSIKEAAEK